MFSIHEIKTHDERGLKSSSYLLINERYQHGSNMASVDLLADKYVQYADQLNIKMMICVMTTVIPRPSSA